MDPSFLNTDDKDNKPEVTYLCGECGSDVPLKLNDAVRCRGCGGRILYKKRTKKVMQYEAR